MFLQFEIYHRIQEVLGTFWGAQFLENVFPNLVKLKKTTEITKTGKYYPIRPRIERK